MNALAAAATIVDETVNPSNSFGNYSYAVYDESGKLLCSVLRQDTNFIAGGIDRENETATRIWYPSIMLSPDDSLPVDKAPFYPIPG